MFNQVTFPGKIQTFWTQFTLREKLMVPIVFLSLGAARLMVKTLHFRRYASLFGRTVDIGTTQPTTHNSSKAIALGRLIRTVAKNTPWTSNCLAQAIVAAFYLRVFHIPFTVHFGVKKSNKPQTDLEAHAWVMSADKGVTGYRESLGMTPVSTFIYPSAL